MSREKPDLNEWMNLIQRKTKIQRPKEESYLIQILKKNQKSKHPKNQESQIDQTYHKIQFQEDPIQEHPNPKNQTN